jgi:hypothetical protein
LLRRELTHCLQRPQPLLVALQVLPLLFDFAVERPLVVQQRLDVFLRALQLTGDCTDGAGYMVFDFFQVRVACESMLPCDAKLLLRTKQLMQRRPSLRELAGNFANGADFT